MIKSSDPDVRAAAKKEIREIKLAKEERRRVAQETLLTQESYREMIRRFVYC
jgi:hypothetical protein